MYHSKDMDHDTKNCNVLKDQARKMHGQHKAQHSSGKKDYRVKKEMQAMISQVTKYVFASLSPVKKRQMRDAFPAPCSDDTENVILQFEDASISQDSKKSAGSSISSYRQQNQSDSSSTGSAGSENSTSDSSA